MRTLTADIVAIDMPLMWNRLGAQNINGMMYALRNDVVNLQTNIPLTLGGAPTPGLVGLRPDKRPRPLVLRMGKGDCLTIKLANLLTDNANFFNPFQERSKIPFRIPLNDAVAERRIGLRFQGTEVVGNMGADSSNVGTNTSSLVGPGGSTEFMISAPQEGTFVGESMGATTGGEGLGGHTPSGLWAVLNVNTKDSSFYRSQLTREEMDLAIDKTKGINGYTTDGHPIINYEATYPNVPPWSLEGKGGLPVVNMVNGGKGGKIVHSDLNAIVAYGPEFKMASPAQGKGIHANQMGHFPDDVHPLEKAGFRNPTAPNRLEPYREFTIAFHDEVNTENVFPKWFNDPVLSHTLHGVRDGFMINYGSGGVGSEIIANRLRVGPMHDCVACAYEEFFLTFHAVGEVGQLVDIPANFGLENCSPNDIFNTCKANGPKANYALYPDDPSNVHHSYQSDAIAFRNVHAGGGEQHVFHLHNHQWLFNPEDDNSNYLDAQGLGPGAGYTYWINFGGAGNRNKSAGDVIFHCHFYPHFAQGMWEMWRVHDTFEQGTELQTTIDGGGAHVSFVTDKIGLGKGLPSEDARALPDGEIVRGVPIPAVVPLPGKPMAPMPAEGVTVTHNSNEVCVGPLPTYGLKAKENGVCPTGTSVRFTGSLAVVPRVDKGGSPTTDITKMANPGYPFWIAGIEHTVGQRPPAPPLDMMDSKRAAALQTSKDANGNLNPLWQHPGFTDAASVQGWDGGLPRFTLDGYSAGGESIVAMTRLDLSKEMEKAKPFFFPEEGTDIEQAVMMHHSKRCHDTVLPDGTLAPCVDGDGESLKSKGGYITNGALPVPGAPYYEPCIDDRGKLMAGGEGRFFGSKLTAMDDFTAMSETGKSPFTAITPRVYKGAAVQFDAVFNKLGYHFSQQRITALWQDVVPTIKKQRPPEPMVLRINTFDCTTYVHSNVVPKAYELDDYQVRTPTDIIGQHIHLPKWDLVSADGSANGWNYEDGTLSPEAVVEVIEAINHWQNAPENAGQQVTTYTDAVEGPNRPVETSAGVKLSAGNSTLTPAAHPFFGATEFAAQWVGARSTIQRWFADPVLNVQGVDRGLGIIFTHDHFGPSTHQQIGLYATVLMEPAGSKWVHNETGTKLYTRTGPNASADGGPTSWQAAILTGANGIDGYTGNVKTRTDNVESYREFYLEYSDFQHAYQPGVYVGADLLGKAKVKYAASPGAQLSPGLFLNGTEWTGAGTGVDQNSFRDAIAPGFREEAPLVGGGANAFPKDIWIFPTLCPGLLGQQPARPCPEAISAFDPGMYVVNYRNESLIARVFDPKRLDCPGGQKGCQAVGKKGDLALAMDSSQARAISDLNSKLGKAPTTYGGNSTSALFLPPINQLTALVPGDPFTPMLRAYDGDRVHVKVQGGGQEEEHTVLMHGLKWLQAGSGYGEAKNSGWRNAQPGGISEQFSLRMPIFADIGQRAPVADYAYTTNNGFDGWASGVWGIIRSYKSRASQLYALPTNDPAKSVKIANAGEFDRVCPLKAPVQTYDITAVLAEDVLDVPRDVNGKSLVGDANGNITDPFPGSHMGRSPQLTGGTLVYNSRTTNIPPAAIVGADPNNRRGPLHDPAGILYVKTSDLVADNDKDPRCFANGKLTPSLPTCPVHLNGHFLGDKGPAVPVEPIVIRAAAGDCINVTLRNKTLEQAVATVNGNQYPVFAGTTATPVFLDNGQTFYADTNNDGIGDLSVTRAQIRFDRMPELANLNPLLATVRLNRDDPQGMTTVQSNVLEPSSYVGLHPALVEYDITKSDGVSVGQNPTKGNIAAPGEQTTYQWFAGHISANLTSTSGTVRNYTVVTTPIEFGGFNITGADKIKQPQHGLVAAGAIYPQGATWTVDPGTNTSAIVMEPANAAGGPWTFRDFSIVAQKGVAMVYSDSYPMPNVGSPGPLGVAEDSQDMGGMAINYGTEPLWFRFGVSPIGHGVLSDVAAGDAYSNTLAGNSDPQTAVFKANRGQPFHMHVLMPAGAARGSTFDLHGHVWHRDPYVCPPPADANDDGLASKPALAGRCSMGKNGVPGASDNGVVGSQRLAATGNAGQWRFENPVGMAMGGIESWYPGEHYEVVAPSAGGTGDGNSPVLGDYLFRDHMGLGNAAGLWGILRVCQGQSCAPTVP